MKPDNWIDGLIWKSKNSGMLYQVSSMERNPDRHVYLENLKNDNWSGWDGYERLFTNYELTNLTEEEARLIESL